MIKIKTIQYFSFAAIAAVLIVAFSAPLVFANHAWANYHWARTTPSFNLQLKNNMSNQWQSSLLGAVTDWNQSTVTDFALIKGSTRRSASCLGTNGMVEICNSTYGQNGWLGIAEVWVNGDHITKGTVKLNDTYYSTPTYNTAAWRNAVVCQEIGHTLGLGHNDEDFTTTNGTCMDYSYDPVPNQHPDFHDYAMLETIYAHLDTFDSYAKAGGSTGGGKGKPQAVGQDIDRSTPDAWGQVVKHDAQNNPSLYKRALPDGTMVFTHVTWVPGFDGHEEHLHE